VEVIRAVVGRVHVHCLRIDEIQVGDDEAAGSVVGDGQVGVVEGMVHF